MALPMCAITGPVDEGLCGVNVAFIPALVKPGFVFLIEADGFTVDTAETA